MEEEKVMKGLIPELESKHVWILFVAAILSSERKSDPEGKRSLPTEIAKMADALVNIWVEKYE